MSPMAGGGAGVHSRGYGQPGCRGRIKHASKCLGLAADVDDDVDCCAAREPQFSSNWEMCFVEHVQIGHALPPAKTGVGSNVVRTGKLCGCSFFSPNK